MDEKKFYTEYPLNFIPCRNHKNKQARRKFRGSDNETLYLCSICAERLSKDFEIRQSQELQKSMVIKLQNRKYKYDEKLFSSTSVITINKIFSYQRWKNFGKKNIDKAYTPEREDMLGEIYLPFFANAWENGKTSILHTRGGEKFIVKYIQEKNYLFNFNGEPVALMNKKFEVIYWFYGR